MARKRKDNAPRQPKSGTIPCCLRCMMPTEGMTYPSEERLMHNLTREERVTNALQSRGYLLSSGSVMQAFVDIFRSASPLVHKARAQGFSLWDALPWVQRESNWAHSLPEAIFFELFTCLVEARREWLKNTTPDLSKQDNNWFVQAIDVFRRDVGDCPKDGDNSGGDHVSWILVDAVFFNELAGGFDQDEDEVEDTQVKDAEDAEADDGEEFNPYKTDGVIAQVVPPMK